MQERRNTPSLGGRKMVDMGEVESVGEAEEESSAEFAGLDIGSRRVADLQTHWEQPQSRTTARNNTDRAHECVQRRQREEAEIRNRLAQRDLAPSRLGNHEAYFNLIFFLSLDSYTSPVGSGALWAVCLSRLVSVGSTLGLHCDPAGGNTRTLTRGGRDWLLAPSTLRLTCSIPYNGLTPPPFFTSVFLLDCVVIRRIILG